MPYGIFDGEKLIRLFETERAAVIDAEAGTVGEVREVAFSHPLDPEPWEHKRSRSERAHSLDSLDENWEFYPRRGFARDAELYGVFGGIDPAPYVIVPPDGKLVKGRTRYQRPVETKNATCVFSPRDGFEQDESKYAHSPDALFCRCGR